MWREASPAQGTDATRALRYPAGHADAGLEEPHRRHGFAESPHQPVCSGVEDEPHLVGVGRATGGPVALELGLVQLDQILGLAARARD